MDNEEISSYDSVSEFYKGVSNDAKKLDNSNVDYCIVVYEIPDTPNPNPHCSNKVVKFIYKTIQDFLDNFPKAVEESDNNDTAYIQIWQYD